MKSSQPAHSAQRQFCTRGEGNGVNEDRLGGTCPVPTTCLNSALGKAPAKLRWEIKAGRLRVESSSEALSNATDTIKESKDAYNEFLLCQLRAVSQVGGLFPKLITLQS